MDYKEKDIWDRIHKMYDDMDEDGKSKVERVFPELKESEDDKVRKKLIHLVKKSHEQGGYALHKWESDEMLAWLEKQEIKEHDVCDTCDEKASCVNPCPMKLIEEQNPADKVKPKFKVGDKVLVDGKVYTIKLVNEDNYIVDENGRDVQEHFSYTKDWKLIRQSSIWNEEDETGLSDTLWAIQQARTIAKDENDMGSLWYAEEWLKSLKNRLQ